MKEIKKSPEFTYDIYENMSVEEQEKLMHDLQKDLGISVVSENGVEVLGVSDDDAKEEKGEDAMEAIEEDDDLPFMPTQKISMDK